MRKFNRPLAALAGIGLSVLVSLGAPIGSAVTAVAAPTGAIVALNDGGSAPSTSDGPATLSVGNNEQPGTTTAPVSPSSPDSTLPDEGEGDGTSNPPAGGDQSNGEEQPASDELTVGRPSPDSELGADSSNFMPMSVPVGTGEDLHHMPDPGRPYLAFEVKDTLGNLVPGATVNVQGPRQGNTNNNSDRWGPTVSVTDCATGTLPCPANSLDQDSRPGKFAVDRLASQNNAAPLTSSGVGSRYRVGASGAAPAGYQWTTSALTGLANGSPNVTASIQPVPGGSGSTQQQSNMNTALPGEWENTTTAGTNMVHTFSASPVLQRFQPSCSADVVYGVSSSGQIQQLVKGTGDTAVITTVGSALSGESSFNGLGIGPDGTSVYGYNRNGTNAKVYKFNISAGTWAPVTTNASDLNAGGSLVAGAVAPDGTYYMGLFATNTTFKLWKLAGTTVSEHGTVTLPNSSSNGNGDMAFDSAGNLYIVRGVNNGTSLETFLVTKGNLALANGSIPSTRIFNGNAPFSSVNGVAYDSTGKLYVGGSSAFGYATLPSPATPQLVTVSGGTLSSTDLATCSYPPTVKLQKYLPEGRAFAADQFGLEILEGGTLTNGVLSGGTSLGTATASTPALGLQDQAVGPIPAGTGTTVSIRETFLNGAIAANYASSWQCTVGGVEIAGGSGMGAVGQFTIPTTNQGEEVLCTFKNTALGGEKTSNPASGEIVTAGQVVTYTLTFDNSAGVSPITVNFRDHLADVLDDAGFVYWTTPENSQAPTGARTTPDPNYAGSSTLTASYDSSNQWLNIGGSVPAGGISTVSFKVRAKENDQDWKERQDSEVPLKGYLLRNYLTRGNIVTPPETCEAPGSGMPSTCTEHPIPAWSFNKSSLPVDGASLHKGGNVHYRLTAMKMNFASQMGTLTFTDDLTQAFKSAGWAPDAAVPGGALPRGVYFFDGAGQTLDVSGAVTAAQPSPAYGPNEVGPPQNVDGKWILQKEVVVPEEAMSAELWFAVQAAESPAGIPVAANAWEGEHAPSSGWSFVNYATATATTISDQPFRANRCDTTLTEVPNTGKSPTDVPPNDPNFPAECQVTHSIDANYFTIRKDAAGAGENLPAIPAFGSDPTGLWNMIGHEFEIYDDENGAPSSLASKYLCRTEYAEGLPNSPTWDGNFVSSGTLDAGIDSLTLEAIKEWNNQHTDLQLPECAVAYAQQNAGGQTGRWKVENLPEKDRAFPGTANATASGDYWLVETKAPDKQISLDGTQQRDVPGVQLLAEPVPFRVWQLAPGDPIAGSNQSMQGHGQLDVAIDGGYSAFTPRCEPSSSVVSRPFGCVNPTGYLMIIKDSVPAPLPLTGGKNWAPLMGAGGGLILVASIGGIIWWRRRQAALLANASVIASYSDLDVLAPVGGRHAR